MDHMGLRDLVIEFAHVPLVQTVRKKSNEPTTEYPPLTLEKEGRIKEQIPFEPLCVSCI